MDTIQKSEALNLSSKVAQDFLTTLYIKRTLISLDGFPEKNSVNTVVEEILHMNIHYIKPPFFFSVSARAC
ncbi:unnamed protein product [Nippostrongylus brasiliensis]|uniref:Transposase n=1 Tax=Nippostrongylus brasiliensis TaxID=27835 RepID=A0A0N4Y6V1_NIPBR|nr:unnamed protein product [Nippostrongylus brasiliensis]